MACKYYIKGIRRFDRKKVEEKTHSLFLNEEENYNLMVLRSAEKNGETESYTVLTEDISTQGVTISCRIDGLMVVELPWLASIMDVRFCFAFLRAVKKVHPMVRIVGEDGKDVGITDEEARNQWFVRCDNMCEILEKGEDVTIKGCFRDFFIHPDSYGAEETPEDKVYKAFADFARLQWLTIGFGELLEENRHVVDDEELSTVRVIDNTKNCFIGDCSFVGLMRGNTCKMMRLCDFYSMVEDGEYLVRLDYRQALFFTMPDDKWSLLFEKAQGVVRENYRKTFIMRWNTDISGYTMADFEDSMVNFDDDGFYFDWSIWDFRKVHVGDRFYMVRTGNGANGVVMRGSFIGMPYVDDDWSGRGRKVYYIRMQPTHLIHPDWSPALLTTEVLSSAIPGFNWQEGHSGELLTDSQAAQLEMVWKKFLTGSCEMRLKEDARDSFDRAFKEKRTECESDVDKSDE